MKKWIPIIKEKSDVIILLSHLGLPLDEQIAAEIPEVDVILGGHTHHTLPEGKLVGYTLLAGAGKHGNFVGHISLSIDANKKLLRKEAQLYDVMDLPVLPDEKTIAQGALSKGEEIVE